MRSSQITYRITALTLAFLMLFTSVGFAVDMHYCQGNLKSFNFIGKAKTCHELVEATPMKNCSHHQQMAQQNEGCAMDQQACCKNKTLHFQSDQDQQIQSSAFLDSKLSQYFVVAFVFSFLAPDYATTKNLVAIKYKPPLIPRDIPVLTQTFLL